MSSEAQYEPSEGELFIADYFESKNIKYREQVKIENLDGDLKAYRVADFYIPQYKVYIEFYGQWNSNKESRERYREKKGIYYKNYIPCIYLYPENLGILDYSFHTRMVKELKRRKSKKDLFKYRINRFNQIPYNNDSFLIFLFMIFFLFIVKNQNIYPLFVLATIFSGWNFLNRLRKAFDIKIRTNKRK